MLAYVSNRLFNVGAGLFLIFYGSAWIIRGSLMIRSGYLPAWLGALMILGGFGFAARTLTSVLTPEFSPTWLLFLMAPGGVVLALWLLARGVNAEKWEAKA